MYNFAEAEFAYHYGYFARHTSMPVYQGRCISAGHKNIRVIKNLKGAIFFSNFLYIKIEL